MVNHYTITLSATARSLATGLEGIGINDILKFLAIQATPGNTHVAYIGGNQRTLTTSDYGFRIEAPVTSIPYAPTVIELAPGFSSLSEIFAVGTADEKLQIFLVF